MVTSINGHRRAINGAGFGKATLKDVAAMAGVSVTTVSHLMTGRAGVCSDQTAERIRSVVRELKYVPNGPARELNRGSTRTIGVCMTSPWELSHNIEGSFAQRLMSGVTHVADEQGYLLLQYPLEVRLGRQMEPLLNSRADGLILSSCPTDPRAQMIADVAIPLVLVVQFTNVPDGVGCVYADEQETVAVALDYLWSLGHRRIAHLAGPVEEVIGDDDWPRRATDSAVWRRKAYIEWMGERGIFDPRLIAYGQTWEGIDVPETTRALREMPDPPTALFCASDPLALKVIEAAHEMGWEIPGKLSVVGVDNAFVSALSHPALTTIELPIRNVGAEAMRLLLRIVHNDPISEYRVKLTGSKLIQRASTSVRAS
ncbi:MAG: LacI family DNA-binding transcriptional regulator [Capsulimonadaceae bacterium]|nr:LacI family DNA-binding transcriptional regulator [Capsulimonadaceae bacterium]